MTQEVKQYSGTPIELQSSLRCQVQNELLKYLVSCLHASQQVNQEDNYRDEFYNASAIFAVGAVSPLYAQWFDDVCARSQISEEDFAEKYCGNHLQVLEDVLVCCGLGQNIEQFVADLVQDFHRPVTNESGEIAVVSIHHMSDIFARDIRKISTFPAEAESGIIDAVPDSKQRSA